jgi:hypothetical protein
MKKPLIEAAGAPAGSPALSRRELIRLMGGGPRLAGAGGFRAGGGETGRAEAAFRAQGEARHPSLHERRPFQGDLFDPKPAINKFAGQRPAEVQLRTENATGALMPVPVAFQRRGKSGLEVSDLLPHFGEVVDDVCMLRAVYTDNPNHGPGALHDEQRDHHPHAAEHGVVDALRAGERD